MAESFDIAVVGATGMVGESTLEILSERKFPVGTVHALASEQSVGTDVNFGNRSLDVENLADFDFSQVQIGFFSAGASVSDEYAPKAAACGCVVIDNTSRFRYEDNIPLVVPEVNPQRIADYKATGIIANPNCSTIQMVVALKPIYDAAGINRINVSTYQAVSGAGKSAVEELVRQTTALLNGRPLEIEGDAKQIAFNAVPHIDQFQDNRYTSWGIVRRAACSPSSGATSPRSGATSCPRSAAASASSFRTFGCLVISRRSTTSLCRCVSPGRARTGFAST